MAILVFGLIVFIHEFGHFIFAKIFKIKVNEFAIGFGPAICKFQKGETLYAIRILPFGGYCAMEGEDSDSNDERAFFRAAAWKRIIVVAAGAVFNIILGFILMVATVSVSGAIQSQNLLATTQVSSFTETATTNKNNGLKEKDVIKRINGRIVFSVEEVSYMLGTAESNKVDLVVLRDGKKIELNDVEFPQTTVDGKNYLTIDFYFKGEKLGFVSAVKQGFWRTVSMGRIVFMSLGDLLSGKFGLNEVSGPVGVTQIVSEAVTTTATNGLEGLVSLLKILCLITVNLGVFNLLPIPALDGSRILFLVIEWIRKKPVKNEALVHSIGMMILLAFMVLIIFKDLWTWIF